MITIRHASPMDVEYLASIIDMAGRAQLICDSYEGEQKVPLLSLIFPGTEEQRLDKIGSYCLNEERLFFHYSRFKVAEIDDRIAGGLCTSTRDNDKPSLWIGAGRHINMSYGEIMAAFWRTSPYLLSHPSLLKNTLVVEAVATFPDYRRRGVVTALLEDAIEKARREDYPRMQVTTLIGNVSAQRAYEKVGFSVDKEIINRRFEKLFGSPGQVRLILEL